MPVSDTSSAATAAITAATPKRSTSEQLQERLERERRHAKLTQERESYDVVQALKEGRLGDW